MTVVGKHLEPSTLRRGFIPLPLEAWRELAAGVTQNIVANGGLLASDTTPIFERVNGATDKLFRLRWAASNNDELGQSFLLPPDLDPSLPLEVHLIAGMGGATDVPVVAVAVFFGVGDANAGGNTGALAAAIRNVSAVVAPADVNAVSGFGTLPGVGGIAQVSIVPGAHTTDTLLLYGAYIEYSKR